jgi:hypothetical protein
MFDTQNVESLHQVPSMTLPHSAALNSAELPFVEPPFLLTRLAQGTCSSGDANYVGSWSVPMEDASETFEPRSIEEMMAGPPKSRFEM